MLEEVKRSLRILDDDNDDFISDIILRAKLNLANLAGVKLDYENSLARNLLIDYCRYAFNDATEYFEENYQKELNRLIFQEGAKTYEEVEDEKSQ